MRSPVSWDATQLADRLVRRSQHLGPAGNVEQCRNTLSVKNPRLIPFDHLAIALDRNWVDSRRPLADHVEYLTVFWDALVTVRPELGVMSLTDRTRVRRELLVDSAAAIGAYLHVASRLYPRPDFSLLVHLRDNVPGTSLDFFSRQNQIWTDVGVLEPAITRDGQCVLKLRKAKEANPAMRQVVTALLGLDPSTTTAVL